MSLGPRFFRIFGVVGVSLAFVSVCTSCVTLLTKSGAAVKTHGGC